MDREDGKHKFTHEFKNKGFYKGTNLPCKFRAMNGDHKEELFSMWSKSLRECKASSGGECGRWLGLRPPTASMCNLANVSEMGRDPVQLSDSAPLARVAF